MIQKVNDIPEKKASRSEIVQALRDLKLGESLLISGQSLTDRTQSQVYRAASRLRLAIRTNKTSVGLRVWLKDSETASIKRESSVPEVEIAETTKDGMYFPKPTSQAEKFANLANLGMVREQMKKIDEEAAPEITQEIVYDADS